MKVRNPFFWVPNFITAMNLVSGCMAVFLGIEGELGKAAILIIAAAVFDFLDGMFARLVKSYSEIGKQLDSLADLVSFGVAPAAILMSMLKQSMFQGTLSFSEIEASPFQWLLLLSVLLVPVAGAFRLAKFNTDTRQSESFLGLPIPANAMFYASLALILDFGKSPALNNIILNPYFIAVIIILFPGLMVSELPMFSLKVKHLKWQGNQVRFSFLILCTVLVLILQLYALPLIMISYILISLIVTIAAKKN
ncbi:MAG: CDP-diacylglycerol--serine O-phosphatidyltransferase [Mangrovibacterium sp.]